MVERVALISLPDSENIVDVNTVMAVLPLILLANIKRKHIRQAFLLLGIMNIFKNLEFLIISFSFVTKRLRLSKLDRTLLSPTRTLRDSLAWSYFPLLT